MAVDLATGADLDLGGDLVRLALGVMEFDQGGRPGTDFKRRLEHQADAGGAGVNQAAPTWPWSEKQCAAASPSKR